MDQEQKTREFFNRISDGYKDKYKTVSPFHIYFFNERLEKATCGINFNNKTVLDIGSGTGDLYDYIIKKYPEVAYYASDISEGMLKKSHVPESNKFVGNCYDISFPIDRFDYIFMLGVTTYMPLEELNKTLHFISERLQKNGTAIITFTNKSAYDTIMHDLLKKPLRLLYKKKNTVITQDFSIYTYTTAEVQAAVEPLFQVQAIDFLNHTIFPFNFLLPSISVMRAKRISQKTKSRKFLERNSSDFILKLTKKQPENSAM
jgi:ubiquinone/menaquinone biosynthesis C-methylase UbiE